MRRGELTSMVMSRIIRGARRSSPIGGRPASADDEGRHGPYPDLHADPVNGVYPADFYSWGLSTFWKPPVGNGGGAAYLPRKLADRPLARQRELGRPRQQPSPAVP